MQMAAQLLGIVCGLKEGLHGLQGSVGARHQNSAIHTLSPSTPRPGSFGFLGRGGRSLAGRFSFLFSAARTADGRKSLPVVDTRPNISAT
jgi:hypothetical protein